MTIDDLTTYSAATDVLLYAPFAVLAIGAPIIALKLGGYNPGSGQGRHAILLAGYTTAVFAVGAAVGGLWITGETRAEAADAQTANAEVLKEWAEPEYGITISDEQAEMAMGAWGSNRAGGLAPMLELTFTAEAPEGTVRLELVEKDNGSFELMKTSGALPPADKEGK